VHLRTFRTQYGKKAHAGQLLHTGSTLDWLAPEVLAAPWWRAQLSGRILGHYGIRKNVREIEIERIE
jgi:hypothetical protein